MVDSSCGTGSTVDVRPVGQRLVVPDTAERHPRDRPLRQPRRTRIHRMRVDDDERVDQMTLNGVDVPIERRPGITRRERHEVAAVLRGRDGESDQEGVGDLVERRPEGIELESDCARTLAAQLLRGSRRPIPQQIDRLANPLQCGRAHPIGVIQRVRHGLARYIGVRRNLVDRHPQGANRCRIPAGARSTVNNWRNLNVHISPLIPSRA